jgi:dTDP-4-dehydrorhamnose 3,5-epimerase
MEFTPTDLPEVVLIRPKVFGDARGYFMESWEERKFAAGGLELKFIQDNHSHSARHILRGLHYQIQHPQGKLVRVVTGTVYDVAVDIRRGSPTFGKWVGVELSAENHHMLWVPPGFAHGYLVLSESADFLYKVTDVWSPPHERAIRWNDPDIGVKWPLPPGTGPVLSGKDAAAVSLGEAEVYP